MLTKQTPWSTVEQLTGQTKRTKLAISQHGWLLFKYSGDNFPHLVA